MRPSSNNSDSKNIIFNSTETQYSLVKNVAYKLMNFKPPNPNNQEWDIYWTDQAVNPEFFSRMKPYQKINHFPSMYSLSRKNHLARHLTRMKTFFPEDYDFFPRTWLLPAEYGEFSLEMKSKGKIFIVKPQASSQGKGIFLTNTLSKIPLTEHYVAQSYIEDPYLIDGLKFDLRLYVLLTGSEPLRVFLYNEGLARFSTEEFEGAYDGNLDNICMHLTNYAVNKKNKKFSSDEQGGHKRSLTSIFEILRKNGENVEVLISRIEALIVKTVISVQPILSHCYRSCQPNDLTNSMCFEILGFDILLDKSLKPWLLEVNHTPSFNTDTAIDLKIKTELIKDTLILLNLTPLPRLNHQRSLRLPFKRLSVSSKNPLITQIQQNKTFYEDLNLNKFIRIYPFIDKYSNVYEVYREKAIQIYKDATGTDNCNKKVIKNEENNQKDKEFQIYKQNKAEALGKIYSQKIENPHNKIFRIGKLKKAVFLEK